MQTENLYYTAPPDEVFEEVKRKALTIWNGMDSVESYRLEKTSKIEPLENIQDNMMSIVAMFDEKNQQKLSVILSDKARDEVYDRIMSESVQGAIFSTKLINFIFTLDESD